MKDCNCKLCKNKLISYYKTKLGNYCDRCFNNLVNMKYFRRNYDK